MRRVIFLLTVMAAALVLGSGLALAVNRVGTQGRDFLKGSAGADHLVGKGENDRIFSLAGNDTLIGGPGKDWVWGGSIRSSHRSVGVDYTSSGGNKTLVGGPGNDVVFGGNGSDNILGNEGNDLVANGSKQSLDKISAGEGNDVVGAVNDPASQDMVTCGGGFDRVFADRKDAVAPDCERVADSGREYDQLGASIPQSFWKSLPYPIGPQYPSRPQDYAKAQGLAKAFEKENINPLVGDWRRNLRCEEYVRRMKQAGLADMLPDNPCQGKKVLQHDHIFYRDGRFTSLNGKGDFVDNDHYILPNDHTIVFPGSGSETFPPVTAHFRFSDHLNTVTFDLVVPKNLDECSERCQGAYEWAISVFYSGLPWHRVCQADNRDNDVNGRTDELGEHCWMDPVNGFSF